MAWAGIGLPRCGGRQRAASRQRQSIPQRPAGRSGGRRTVPHLAAEYRAVELDRLGPALPLLRQRDLVHPHRPRGRRSNARNDQSEELSGEAEALQHDQLRANEPLPFSFPGSDLRPDTPPPSPNVEPLEAHATHATCASCYRKIDPLGFAFDNYDAIGRWRTCSNPRPWRMP